MHVQLHVPHAHRRTRTQREARTTPIDRETRLTRDLAVLVAVATGGAVLLWAAAATGAADDAWWPLLLVAAIGLLAALGGWVARRDR
jgi:hypothetical protein